MAKKSLTKPLHPELLVYAQTEKFDNAFAATDTQDEASIKQYGNGETLVKNDNPDDVEDKIVDSE